MTPDPVPRRAQLGDGRIYRMPVGFGPSLGPRQGEGDQRFGGSQQRVTMLTTAFVTGHDELAELLPPGFVPAAEPLVTVRARYNREQAWLAGRSYNYVEILFAAEFHGEQDRESGDFIAVMWESMADPIITGREEAGHPKLFADVPEPELVDGSTVAHASWCGFRFLEMTFDGLELGPWPDGDAGDDEVVASMAPRMNYKYIPGSADLGRPDVAYAVMMPTATARRRVLEHWTGTGRVGFTRARWEDLPTFAQVPNGLAGLPVREWRDASMTRAVVTFDDLRDDMRVLR